MMSVTGSVRNTIFSYKFNLVLSILFLVCILSFVIEIQHYKKIQLGVP